MNMKKMNKADFYPGDCTICFRKVLVRAHENIYLVGSEGSRLCEDCESHMRVRLNERRRFFINAELKRRMEKK